MREAGNQRGSWINRIARGPAPWVGRALIPARWMECDSQGTAIGPANCLVRLIRGGHSDFPVLQGKYLGLRPSGQVIPVPGPVSRFGTEPWECKGVRILFIRRLNMIGNEGDFLKTRVLGMDVWLFRFYADLVLVGPRRSFIEGKFVGRGTGCPPPPETSKPPGWIAALVGAVVFGSERTASCTAFRFRSNVSRSFFLREKTRRKVVVLLKV